MNFKNSPFNSQSSMRTYLELIKHLRPIKLARVLEDPLNSINNRQSLPI